MQILIYKEALYESFKFKNLINKIIHFYNNKAYNDMELALIELNKEAIKNNYPIEITSIRLLTKELQNMVKRNTLEKNISNINNIPLDNIKDTINLAHKQRIVNTQQLLLLIDKMIDTLYEKSKYLIIILLFYYNILITHTCCYG